jgi:hypothetical protein
MFTVMLLVIRLSNWAAASERAVLKAAGADAVLLS